MDDKINKTLRCDVNQHNFVQYEQALTIRALDAIPFQIKLFGNVLITSGPASHMPNPESF